ncbi:hypothetical protein L208DRAFT_1378652 [Tricholoma matsutake]|nr:hypothetical protein L208DRAFT_1378652 [Tricholoma matsutake 945]
MSKQIALLIQVFGAELAVPHMNRFQARCVLEGVQPPSVPAPGNQLQVDGTSYLPLPVAKNSPHIHAQCHPAGTYLQDIVIHSMQPTSVLAPAPDSKPLVANDSTKFEIKNETWWRSAATATSKYDDLPVQQ